MLIRLFPETQETPTILFSLAPPSLTSNIPLPSYYNSQLETLGSYGLPPPRSVYALDKAGWALALLEEVIFDLSVGKVGVKWVDGGVEEWDMVGEGLKRMLLAVVRGVKESEQRREDEKREELVKSLLLAIPTSEQASSLSSYSARPSSRLLRRQARSTLLDAFRLHVVHHLAQNHRRRSSYPLWIARRCLEVLMADLNATGTQASSAEDDEESLGTEDTFDDTDMEMDPDGDGDGQIPTPNTSVASIAPCDSEVEDLEAMYAGNDANSELVSPTVFEGGFDQSESEAETAFEEDSEPETGVPHNPYPSLPLPESRLPTSSIRTRLPLAEPSVEVQANEVTPSVQLPPLSVFEEAPSQPQPQPPASVPAQEQPQQQQQQQQPPPQLLPNPQQQQQQSFLQTLHLHALISHLEYEEDRARAYLDPETNPERQHSSSRGAGRKGSRLRHSFTIEDLIALADEDGDDEEEGELVEEKIGEDGELDVELDAYGLELPQEGDAGVEGAAQGAQGAEEAEDLMRLIPPAEAGPIFDYDSESDSDYYTSSGEESDPFYLSTPPTSSDEEQCDRPTSPNGQPPVLVQVRDYSRGRGRVSKRLFFVKRKPSPSLVVPTVEASIPISGSEHDTPPSMPPAPNPKQTFFSPIPLPPADEDEAETEPELTVSAPTVLTRHELGSGSSGIGILGLAVQGMDTDDTVTPIAPLSDAAEHDATPEKLPISGEDEVQENVHDGKLIPESSAIMPPTTPPDDPPKNDIGIDTSDERAGQREDNDRVPTLDSDAGVQEPKSVCCLEGDRGELQPTMIDSSMSPAESNAKSDAVFRPAPEDGQEMQPALVEQVVTGHKGLQCPEVQACSEPGLGNHVPSVEDSSVAYESKMTIETSPDPDPGPGYDENTLSPEAAPPRPPSPPPFISSRAADASDILQYDFEWGKHSHLARAVLIRNWNNPMDSDDTY